MFKAALRTENLDKRKALTRGRYWTFNEAILEHVKSIDWSPINTVHLFLPITENKEVDTFSVLQYFKETWPAMRIVIPKTNFATLQMENVLFDPLYTILGKNKYGIPEPIHGRRVPDSEIDVVFMPLLAFDRNGNRVGYGKGFYDRFLSGCRQDVIKVGLSFFEPVDEVADLNEFDKPIDLCITPSKVLRFNAVPL